jgi:glycerol-3-phosphate O-acyltransferase
MALRVVEEPVEAVWPAGETTPVVFLLDAASTLEQRLLLDWVAASAPEAIEWRTVQIPSSRRRWRRRGTARLRRLLEGDGDPLLAPLRVVWLAGSRGKRRSVRLIDLLTFGDPRDPGRLREWWTLQSHPERALVVIGDSAPASELRERWIQARARRPDDPSGFADFVSLQASLALERAERRVRGNRYKVPRFLQEDLLTRASFQVGLARLADRTGEEVRKLVKRSTRYLKEMAATHSPYVIDLVAALIRLLYTQGYHARILYDRIELEELAALSQQHSLVFLPSHKSNLDHLVLTYVLYENGLPPNHAAGGVNMNFFPVGPLIRRAGVFFIRRSFKDNETYKFVLKQYLDYLLSKRFPLEWFIEGGRSRTGKLREPRFGLLAYVADSFRRGSCEDAALIPVAIAYDQIHDLSAYAAEQRGAAKEREGFRWFIKAVQSLRRRHGRISVCFGEPLLLSERLARYGPDAAPEPDADAREIRKLGYEVGARINRVTPITPISLVTLVLLGARDRALTVSETLAGLRDYLEGIRLRGLPVSEPLSLLETPEMVEASLDALVDHGVVSRFSGGPEVVYSIGPEQHVAAAFYRNTIVHFFLGGAIAELALLHVADLPECGTDAFWDEVWALRDLLKSEFYFPDKHDFAADVSVEVERHYPGWVQALAGGTDPLDVVRSFYPYLSHWALRPFVEAYRVVADVLERHDYRAEIDHKQVLAECMALGKQYHLQRRLQSPESLSTVLFGTGFELARRRGLVELGGPERLEQRRAFAGQIRDVLRRIDVIEALAAARRVGLEDSV